MTDYDLIYKRIEEMERTGKLKEVELRIKRREAEIRLEQAEERRRFAELQQMLASEEEERRTNAVRSQEQAYEDALQYAIKQVKDEYDRLMEKRTKAKHDKDHFEQDLFEIE